MPGQSQHAQHSGGDKPAYNTGRKRRAAKRRSYGAGKQFHKFLELPAELREKIYVHHFDRNLMPFRLPEHAVALLFTCKLIHTEAEPVLYKYLTDDGERRFSLAVTGCRDRSIELRRPVDEEDPVSKSFLHGLRGLHTMQFLRFVDIVFVSDQQTTFHRFSTKSAVLKDNAALLSSMPLLVALDIWWPWPKGPIAWQAVGKATPPQHAKELMQVALRAESRLSACGLFPYPRSWMKVTGLGDLVEGASAAGWISIGTDEKSLEFRRLKPGHQTASEE